MKLSLREKLSYGIGAFGKDIVYMVVSSYILFYYESVIGINAVYIGFVLMAARIFDAFNDPIMGVIVAKTKSRWGKFRPWIFSGTVLNAIVLYALFAVPDAFDHGAVRVWLAVFYVLWGVTYTFMDIPFWSMIPAITEVGKERENVSSLARSCSGIGSAVPTVLTMIIVPAIGAGSAMANYRIGFKYWALIIAVVFIICETICCFNVKEKSIDQMESHGVGEMFRSLISNDQAIVVVITIIVVNSAMYLTSNLLIYYFTYDIGDGEGAYSLFAAFGGASQIIAMMLFPLIRKKFNKNQVFHMALYGEIIGYLLLLAIAFTGITSKSASESGWMVLFIPGFLVFFGSGLFNVLTTIFLSDTIDYGELKNKRRDESVIFSMQTFVVKLASAIAILLASIAISLVGLKTGDGMTAASQSAAALNGLRFVMTVIPIVGLFAAYFIFKKYKLDENRMMEIVDELRNHRGEKKDDSIQQ
jgi:melibiose permease